MQYIHNNNKIKIFRHKKISVHMSTEMISHLSCILFFPWQGIKRCWVSANTAVATQTFGKPHQFCLGTWGPGAPPAPQPEASQGVPLRKSCMDPAPFLETRADLPKCEITNKFIRFSEVSISTHGSFTSHAQPVSAMLQFALGLCLQLHFRHCCVNSQPSLLLS